MVLNDRSKTGARGIRVAGAAVLAALMLTGSSKPCEAQGMMQLTVPSKEYTLGRFHYTPPQVDGWRQLANVTDSFSMVYAEQTGEDAIETRFGVAIEVHEIPGGTQIESAAALANLSKKQMAEARGADLVALSPVEAVPSIENLYTYRLLVRSPIEGQPDAYEVYYVAMAPDKTQYLVAQCITKTQDYGNEIYFNQFYGSLASIRYVPEGTASSTDAPKDAASAAGKTGEGDEKAKDAGAADDAAPAAN